MSVFVIDEFSQQAMEFATEEHADAWGINPRIAPLSVRPATPEELAVASGASLG